MSAAEQSQIANATQLKEKETDKSVSLSSGCAYTPVVVEVARFELTTSASLTQRSTKLSHTSKKIM